MLVSCLSLAERSQIKLYIPAVALGELKSQIAEGIKNTGIELEALSALEKLAPSQLRPNANQIVLLLSEFVAAIEKAAHVKLENWIRVSNVHVLDIKPTHTLAVFESYFSGGAPFKDVKSRDDLPDAFIYQATKDLATELGELLVVVRDSNLATHIKKIEGVKVYEDIHSLQESGDLPVRIERDAFALRQALKECREEITALAKDAIFEDLESSALDLDALAENPDLGSIQIERVASLRQLEIEDADPIVIGTREFLYRFKAVVTVIASRQASDGDGQIGTFGILGTNRVRALYEASLSGSLLLAVEGPGTEHSSIIIKSAIVETSVVEKFEKQDSGPVQSQLTELRLEVSDSKILRQSLRNLSGFVFVVGRSRKRRISAGLSLLTEAATEHPDCIFFGPAESLLNNPLGNISSLDRVIQRPYDGVLGPSETDRIIALQPQGVMILAETDDQYAAAQTLRTAGIFVIGISSSRREENIPEEFDQQGPPPETVVRAI